MGQISVSAAQESESLPPTPPNTPSPPKQKRVPFQPVPPKSGKKRTLASLKVHEKVFVPFKKRKLRETAVELMDGMHALCEDQGESISTVLGESCLLTGKVGRNAQEVISSVVETVLQEKGIKVAFQKLIPKEVWEEKGKSTRVPDWVHLLFKLKSRISDKSWQDLINLTKLGRTGVSSCKLCLVFHVVLLHISESDFNF